MSQDRGVRSSARLSTGSFSLAVLALVAWACACAGVQYDPKTATFYEGEKKGGVVLTPQGAVFRDNDDVPEPVIFRDAEEAWRAPLGFILPKSGKFTKTSTATTLATQGLAIVLRPSDTRVPSWGGEILLRVDVHATAAAGTTRAGESVAIVVDGEGEEVDALVEVAVAQLGARDRLTVIDARGPRVLVPTMPATHRSLALAATGQRLARPKVVRDVGAAISMALASHGKAGPRRTLVISREAKLSAEKPVTAAIAVHVANGASIAVVDPKDAGAPAAAQAFIPPAGPISFRDLAISFAGSPSPSRVLEATSGENLWTLDGTDLVLGDVRAGEARSEVLRITVPPWVPGTRYELRVEARTLDAASGKLRFLPADIFCTYDNDLERIAESRHGDVIAYASALATLHRLHAAFVGDGVKLHGGLWSLAKMQAQSLALLARDFPDRGFAEDAAVLQALLDAAKP